MGILNFTSYDKDNWQKEMVYHDPEQGPASDAWLWLHADICAEGRSVQCPCPTGVTITFDPKVSFEQRGAMCRAKHPDHR